MVSPILSVKTPLPIVASLAEYPAASLATQATLITYLVLVYQMSLPMTQVSLSFLHPCDGPLPTVLYDPFHARCRRPISLAL